MCNAWFLDEPVVAAMQLRVAYGMCIPRYRSAAASPRCDSGLLSQCTVPGHSVHGVSMGKVHNDKGCVDLYTLQAVVVGTKHRVPPLL